MEVSYHDMMPKEAVQCYVGYDIEKEKIMEARLLHDPKITEEIENDINCHINNYIRHLVHTEEEPSILSATKMKYDPNAVSKLTESTNIEFDYAAMDVDTVKLDMFVSNLSRDLRLRGYPMLEVLDKSTSEKVALLKTHLDIGALVKEYRSALRINEQALKSQILNPGDLPPCTLHAKMRLTERMIKMLILAGMRLAMPAKKFKEFCEKVEEVVNTNILRRAHVKSPAGKWRVPLDKKDTKKLGDVKLSGHRANLFLAGFDALVEVCCEGYDTEFIAEWKDCCSLFREVMQVMDCKLEFRPQDVDAFQLLADEFCDVYCGLTGRDGMTNYFHILRAGHFSYFLEKYGNLYLLSQQGWENVNSRWKRTFHNNTQKGGGWGGSSKLGPVMYTMARSMLWRHGYLDGLFHALGHTATMDVKYGDIKRIPVKNSGTDALTEVFANTILKLGDAAMLYGDTESGTMMDVMLELREESVGLGGNEGRA